MGDYDVAQVCREGHVITTTAQSAPQFRRAFCGDCGSPTIMACEHCQAPIRGYYHVPGFIGGTLDIELPNYCHECGKPYPWRASGATRR
jgi:hypothetical protein